MGGAYKRMSKLVKSAIDVLFKKGLDLLVGLAAAVLGSTLVPVAKVAFEQYYPLSGFLQNYWELCLAILVATVATWTLALKYLPPAPAFVAHIFLAAAVLVISWMMRLQHGMPNIVWIQFLLWFCGITIVCEIFLIAFGHTIWTEYRAAKGNA